MGEDIDSLFDLLYYCQEGQRVAIVGSRTDDDPIRNSLYIEQEEDRQVEKFLNADAQDGRLLIITGSAGDGKSALLERATRLNPNNSIPDERVNMDATSARAADEDYDSRLKSFFQLISDDLKNRSGHRSALAINYGLAVDFFRLRGYDEEFPKIWEALQQSHQEGHITDHHNIDVLNLSHRRNYDSHPDRLGGGLVRGILDRFDPEHKDSPFTEAYHAEKDSCPAGEACPLRYNVSQLTDETVKDRLAELFAASSIIRGSYLSPRMILDRIAQALLPAGIRDVPRDEVCPVGAAVERGELTADVDDLLWNTAFTVLRTMEKEASFIDPASRTDFETDQRILEWSVNIGEVTSQLASIEIADAKPRRAIATLLRKQYLTGANEGGDSFITRDKTFREFAAALTFSRKELSDEELNSILQPIQRFRSRIESALDNWTGQQNSGSLVEFRDTRRSTDYMFLSEWNSPSLSLEKTKEATQTLSTPGRIRLQIEREDDDANPISVPLSFELYQLMARVSEGYTPNSTDMNRSHAIQMLQTRMSDLTDKRTSVRIQNRTADRYIDLNSDDVIGLSVEAEGFE
jgi:DNA phosphorothioation-dependent restriction protein DptF